jgi:phenol hydroxylase P4 protein
MAVLSLNPAYGGPIRDKVENFHGAQLVFVHWEEHLNFCAAITLPLPANTPFDALTDEILPSLYQADPDWPSVDLANARWMLDGEHWAPVRGSTLGDQGVGHKSLIRFWTTPVGAA